MLEFLSEEWFAKARRSFDEALPLQPGVDARLRYQACDGQSVRRFGQLIGNGQIHWTGADIADADVEVRWRSDDAFEILRGRLVGNDAVAATTIVEERPTGTYEGPPPPLDFANEPTLHELPELPGADLRAALEYTQGPFGTIHYHVCFENGRLATLELGLIEEADVAVSVPFRQVMRFQRGEITVFELLLVGSIRGSEGAIGLFSGILESPEFRRSLHASAAGPGPLAFAALGDVTGQTLYRHLMDELMAETSPPRL